MKRTTTAALSLAVVLSLAACTGGDVREVSDPTSATTDSPFVYSSNLNIITDWDPGTSYSNEVIAMENIYESLTTYDPATKKVLPRLATSWTSADDGTTWTFTLRSGVTFHSGRAADATAAKEAIERTIELKGGPAYIWDAVSSIDAPAPDTLVFHLSYPAPLDLIATSDYAAYIYDTKASGDADLGTWLAEGHDAGTGPYTVESWDQGQATELRLTAYDDYWGGWQDSSYRSVEFRVTPEVTTAWQLLQKGEVTFVKRMNPQLFAQAKADDTVQTSETSSFQNLLALFNTASGPMADLRVRQAVQATIDSTGLISALKGADAPASGIVPSGLIGYTDGLTLEQDLGRATELLTEAGYGAGQEPLTLTLTYAQGDDDQQLFVTLLASALNEVGVKLEATPMQWDAQWDQAKSEDAGARQDIYVMYWYPDYADPYSWFASIFHSSNPPYFNLTYLDDATVDSTIDAMPALTATDPDAADAAYQQLQTDLIKDKATAAPLFVQNYQRSYLVSVQGYTDNPAYPDVVFVHDLTQTS